MTEVDYLISSGAKACYNEKQEADMKKRPNIVLFNPDQFRGDVLGHLGCEAARTPVLDEFVQEDALSFSNAFCQNPVCTPSRCSFMSGLYPHTNGHRTIDNLMKPGEPVLLKFLKDNGYYVWWGGKNDLVSPTAGFEKYCSEKYVLDECYEMKPERALFYLKRKGQRNYYSFYYGKYDEADVFHKDDGYVDGAVQFIEQYDREEPFCIYLPLIAPHPPYIAEEPFYGAIDRDRVKPPKDCRGDLLGKASILRRIRDRMGLEMSDEDWTELRATYLAMCAKVDHQFGRVLEALRKKHIYEDTAVFFFSDHGDYTGDYGLVEKAQNSFEDSITRVPLIVKLPGKGGGCTGITSAMAELLDLPATIAELAGFRLPYTQFGRSLMPVLRGEESAHRPFVFCEGGRLFGERQAMEDIKGLSDDPRNLYYPRLSVQCEETGAHTKAVMIRDERFKYVYRLYERDEFYDLERDGEEKQNLIDSPVYAQKIAAMKEEVLRFLVETCDTVPVLPDARE